MWNSDDTYAQWKHAPRCSCVSCHVSTFVCVGMSLYDYAFGRPHVARTSKAPTTPNQRNTLIHRISKDTCTSHCSTTVAQHLGGESAFTTSSLQNNTEACVSTSAVPGIISKMQCVPCPSTQVQCLPVLLACHQAPDTHPTACSFRATVGISRC